MRRRRHFRRRDFTCPECGHIRTIAWNPRLKRFKARRYGCPECGFIGTRGQWMTPTAEDYAAVNDDTEHDDDV